MAMESELLEERTFLKTIQPSLSDRIDARRRGNRLTAVSLS